MSTRGIYVVAFGDPSRTCALTLMHSIKKYVPQVPVALCADRKIGPEDLLIEQPDSDIGGRRAKLKAYDLTPREWKAVLYLDADTELVPPAGTDGKKGPHPINRFFEWIEDGWEFVICKDPHLMDNLGRNYRRRNNAPEMLDLETQLKTLNVMMWNGGVWAFGRGKRIQAFFTRWQREWERHAQRDQGPLVRAMYADPLKLLMLGNQWNTFPKYTKGIETAGLMHYPGRARRWKGLIAGRIDGDAAWRAVDQYMRTWQKPGRRRRRR